MNASKSLDQFITNESLRFAAFVMWWRQRHAIDPQTLPLQLEPGLWDEALQTFDPQQMETCEQGNNADCFSCDSLSRDPDEPSLRPTRRTAQLAAQSLSVLRKKHEQVEHLFNTLGSDSSDSK